MRLLWIFIQWDFLILKETPGFCMVSFIKMSVTKSDLLTQRSLFYDKSEVKKLNFQYFPALFY